MSFGDQLVKQGASLEKLFVWLQFSPAIVDKLAGVESNVIGQRERSHWIAAAQFHGGIDVLHAAVATLMQSDGFEDVRN